MPQLALQQVVPLPHFAEPHSCEPSDRQVAFPSITSHVVLTGQSVAMHGFSRTQPQTSGDEFQTNPDSHKPSALQLQMPPQSAPPLFGSQPSPGLSPQVPAP